MPLRRLGRSGLVVSAGGLGANNPGMKLDAEQSRSVVHCALDDGVTLYDTADVYGRSAERIGELLQGAQADLMVSSLRCEPTRDGLTDLDAIACHGG